MLGLRHREIQDNAVAVTKEVMNTPDILKRILDYLMRLIPLYEGEELIGEALYIDNLDKWTGLRSYTGSPGCHMGVGRLDDGRYYVGDVLNCL